MEGVLRDCAPDADDALAALVDKSLLRRDDAPDGTARFRMLETIREYAEEQLAARPEDAGRFRRAHAEHYVSRAEAAAAHVFGADQKAVLDAAERDHANVRAALAWATAHGEAVTAMRLVAASWRMWQMRGYLYEGEERARQVLAMPGLDAHPAELAAFLEAAGGLAYWMGNRPVAEDRYSRAL